MDYLDQKEISHFLAKELFYQQFLTLEGLNSGVPTRTTPTLTPTTLRNIEQTFSELQPKPEPHEREAGFVPPLVHPIGNNQYIQASDADIYSNKSQLVWQCSMSQSSSDCDTMRSTPPLSQKTNFTNTPAIQVRRNLGGRKPAKDLNISAEEEERRRVRRERNKAAAARCRKRRVDHTNSLIKETEELERKRRCLEEERLDLEQMKEELSYTLANHKTSTHCNLRSRSPPDIKPFSTQSNSERVKTELMEIPQTDVDQVFLLPSSPKKNLMFSSTAITIKPNRPNSLNIGAAAPKNNVTEIAGIQISTPSHGMTFNYESLMVGGTGLTPVSAPLVPSCSSQQRNIPVSMADMIASSDSSCTPKQLVSL